MERISNEQMNEIKGGAINWGMLAGIGAIASFIIGVIDGWTNPRRCNS